ncbi:MAG: serine hydroxymethyltransferase [Aestuariivirga sp.]|uniref:serine hydroxymethyltransferase n=1 Tax=Aestuariivirga sp. TaxID=2650926 RepID=UPI0025C25E82|nr:serine hydroxymethyltransferase [Aestuariivirga sp.]MCA3561312.1 serine hydroxymethyltransferase [Aestuariivirga sp.]
MAKKAAAKKAAKKPVKKAAKKTAKKSAAGKKVAARAPLFPGFFREALSKSDPKIAKAIAQELGRQQHEIELIASENIVSKAVLEAQGSVMTNKYAEGYPGRRYYGGCQYVDVSEQLAIDRAKALFNCAYANVQPHSGATANQAVFFALLQPGDTYMGLDLACGGHLTHGSPVNQSGKWFKVAPYKVREDNHLIDYDKLAEQALSVKPRLIIAGGSAYPRIIDFRRFRQIADSVGARLMVDMAHFAGLVAGGVHPNPLEYADVVTTTTHKTLRGPRGGLILSNDEDLGKKFNSAVFPGLQGGPLEHVIAAKAVAFGEALKPAFKKYAKAVAGNAKVLAKAMMDGGSDLVSGGTDTHLMLVDLRKKGVTGKAAEQSLGRAYITCNKNGIPFDPAPFTITSGIRLGTPAGTTRGFGAAEFTEVGALINEVLDGLARNGEGKNGKVEKAVAAKVKKLTAKFPIY